MALSYSIRINIDLYLIKTVHVKPLLVKVLQTETFGDYDLIMPEFDLNRE